MRRLPSLGDRRGVAASEFALTLPILLLLVGGIMDVSWLIITKTSLVQAARDGVRRAVPLSLDADPGAMAEDHAAYVLGELGVLCDDTVSCEIESTIEESGGLYMLTVDIQRDYDPLVGLVAVDARLDSSFTMLLENP
jgi:hypothetical protein